MKKITLIIVFLISFFLSEEVFAREAIFSSSESLNSISYVKYDGHYYYFRNAKAIRNVLNNNIAYCIEPFATLIDGTNYTGFIEYDSAFNLTKEQWEKLKLLAYYGYGYKNHLEEKWISITQMLIWRTVDPNHSFNWIDNVNDKNIIYPYNSEIEEIESLVSSHNLIPSIPNEITMSINDSVELFDNSLQLNKFKIIESDIDAKIVDNKLIINSSEEGNKKIILANYDDSLSYSTEFFYSFGTQSVIERGNVDFLQFEVNIYVESGSIKIMKLDSDSNSVIPSGEASLIGAKYSVFDMDNKFIGDIIIGENNIGVLENLSYGKYRIKEVEAGKGYYIDRNEYFVDIDSDNLNVELNLKNDVIKSKIKIIKYYGSNEDYANVSMKVESGITFDFYDCNNKLIYTGITDEFGILEVILPYGKYTIKQVNTTTNYDKVDDITIIVDERSNVSITLPLYDIEIDVPDAYIEDESKFYDFILLLILSILSGFVYVINSK